MSYLVTVTRAKNWWMVSVPQLGGLTQARRLEEAELMAREYIALALAIPRAEVAVHATVLVEPAAD